jgi:hypothetical protein
MVLKCLWQGCREEGRASQAYIPHRRHLTTEGNHRVFATESTGALFGGRGVAAGRLKGSGGAGTG